MQLHHLMRNAAYQGLTLLELSQAWQVTLLQRRDVVQAACRAEDAAHHDELDQSRLGTSHLRICWEGAYQASAAESGCRGRLLLLLLGLLWHVLLCLPGLFELHVRIGVLQGRQQIVA